MKNKKTTPILLKRMSGKESDQIYLLSQEAIVLGNFLQDLQLNGEKPLVFVQRLLWLSKGFYTIRLQHEPQKIIGYSLLYKKDNSFYQGFCILPNYYYTAVIEEAREQLSRLARFCAGITDIKSSNNIYYAGNKARYKSLIINNTAHQVA